MSLWTAPLCHRSVVPFIALAREYVNHGAPEDTV
jgi:hypothetical protein